MDCEVFLDKIAASLGRPRPTEPPARPAGLVPDAYAANPFGGDAELPRAEWPERFKAELEALGGKVHVAESMAEAGIALRTAIESTPGLVITWARSEFAGWDVEWIWDELGATAFASDPLPARHLATLPEAGRATDLSALRARAIEAMTGVTTAQFGIVNTGTLVLLTNANRNRSVSLLPRHHIALVRESGLVARMGEVLATLPGGGASPPSSIHFITGPSRSADIENDLTIGVHGPGAVTVILLRDGPRLPGG